MPLVAWGNGQIPVTLWDQRAGATVIVADGDWGLMAASDGTVARDPQGQLARYALQRTDVLPPTHQRVHICAPGSPEPQRMDDPLLPYGYWANSLTWDWLKAPGRRAGVDEAIFPRDDAVIDWLESGLPAIGRNDPPINPADVESGQSLVFVAVAGQVTPGMRRLYRAARQNAARKVILLFECYHYAVLARDPRAPTFGTTYANMRAQSAIYREMIDQEGGDYSCVGVLVTSADKPQTAARTGNIAYSAGTPDPYAAKATADQDVMTEWFARGAQWVGNWHAYLTRTSGDDLIDAAHRAIRARYPSGPRDQA